MSWGFVWICKRTIVWPKRRTIVGHEAHTTTTSLLLVLSLSISIFVSCLCLSICIYVCMYVCMYVQTKEKTSRYRLKFGSLDLENFCLCKDNKFLPVWKCVSITSRVVVSCWHLVVENPRVISSFLAPMPRIWSVENQVKREWAYTLAC